jgi:hypothetical protein
MREVTTQVELVIDAPADRIWAYRLDFLHLPEYNASVEGMERVDAGDGAGVGATYRFDLVTGAHRSPVELRVTESVSGALVAIDMGGVLPARERFTVSPVGGAGANDGPCLCAIALTLFVPDHFPEEGDPVLATNGEDQMQSELVRMAEILRTGGGEGHRG